jgi:hypothetical protein
MTRTSLAAVVTAAVLLAGCGEELSVPTSATRRSAPSAEAPGTGPSRVISTSTQQAPAGVPPEYQQPTGLSVVADVGWMSSTMAYGGAIATYYANNATLDVDLIARNAQGATVAASSVHAADSYIFPGNHALNRSTNVVVSQTCGLIAQATGHAAAWNSFFTTTQQVLSWGKVAGSDTKAAAQQACATASQPTGNTGGGSYPTTNPMIYPYTYQISTFKPASWVCTIYNTGTSYQEQVCIYYPAVMSDRASSRGMALASRSALAPATLSAANAPAIPSVFVVVSNRVPASALAVIERHQRGPFRNVLLVPSKDIRPAVFAAAMEALYPSRAAQGESPAKDITLELRGTIQDTEVPASLRDYAASFTSLIARARPAFADSYGTTQIVEIRMQGHR